jgi:hypothetical protein
VTERFIATIDSWADRRFVVAVEVGGTRNVVTLIREEAFRGDAWCTTRRPLRIPASAVFLLHDALGRICASLMRGGAS